LKARWSGCKIEGVDVCKGSKFTARSSLTAMNDL
jgi:hypothetical protein